MKKRIFSFLLALTLIAGLLPALGLTASAASSITEAEVVQKLADAEAIWPDHSGYTGSGQCYGFAKELFRYIFGVNMPQSYAVQDPGAQFYYGNGTEYKDNVTMIGHLTDGYSLDSLKELLAQAKPGDVIIASNYGYPKIYTYYKNVYDPTTGQYKRQYQASNHIVIVRSAVDDGSGVYVYDNNYVASDTITTNRLWTAEKIRAMKPYAVTLYRYSGYDVSEPMETAVTISVSDLTLTQGNRKNLQGTINCVGSKLDYVGAVVYNSAGNAVQLKSVSANTNYYALPNSELDWGIAFATLTAGTYTLHYYAHSVDGVYAEKDVTVTVNARGGTQNTNSTSTESGWWIVTVPSNYKLLCYPSVTSSSSSAYVSAKQYSYYIYCTQKATLSNGKVRYFFVSGDNKSLWFDYIDRMAVR